MKNIKFKIVFVFFIALIVSCNDSVDLLTSGAKAGGLVEMSNKAYGYVVGNSGPYTIEFLARQSGSGIESIELYKSFTTTQKYMDGDEEKDTTFVSNEVLERTLAIEEDGDHFFTTDFTYSQLINGLSIASVSGGPEPMPESDGELTIGDSWNFRVVVNTSDGRSIEQSYTFSFSVSTRYAGVYKVTNQEYYRIGVPRPDVAWPETFTVKSIDAKTYQILDYFGPFSGNTIFFQIEEGVISYPYEWPAGVVQTGNGQPIITCDENPVDMASVHCDDTNYVINDDLNGEDLLVMSFGYYTAGSGPREMYCELVKVVD